MVVLAAESIQSSEAPPASKLATGMSSVRAMRRTVDSRSTRWRSAVALVAIALVATACNPGMVTPVAGTGAGGGTGDGGPATSATFAVPSGVLAIPGGGYYVTDASACVIRKVDAAGTIATIAGTGTCGHSGDGGPATAANIEPVFVDYSGVHDFGQSGQLALDAAGNLYLSEPGAASIRRIDPSGTITTLSKSTCAEGSLHGFLIAIPQSDFAVTPNGTIYTACGEGGIYRIDPDGTKQLISSLSAVAITTDPAGTVYVSVQDVDPYTSSPNIIYGHNVIGTLTSTGTFTPVVDVSAMTARTNDLSLRITHLSVDSSGVIYGAAGPSYGLVALSWGLVSVPLASGNAVYRISASAVTKIAGTGSADPATSAQTGAGPQLSITPMGMSPDGDGNLLVTSGHVVYRMADAADADDGTSCNHNLVHPGADFSGIALQGLHLHGCDLTGVDFHNSDLSGSDFTDALFTNTNLTNANLTGADLTGAVGTPIGAATAIYSNTTCPDSTIVTSPTTCVGHGFTS